MSDIAREVCASLSLDEESQVSNFTVTMLSLIPRLSVIIRGVSTKDSLHTVVTVCTH